MTQIQLLVCRCASENKYVLMCTFLLTFIENSKILLLSLMSIAMTSVLFADPDKPEGYDEPFSQQTRISELQSTF